MGEISKIRKMELSELQAILETMSKEDLARTLFWLVGFMSEQDREFWDKFCEAVQSSPYYPEIDKKTGLPLGYVWLKEGSPGSHRYA